MNVSSLLGSKAVLLNTGDICGCRSCGHLLLASSGWLPGMLLNVYNAPGSPLITRNSVQFSSVQSLSRVRLFATPWITARQGSLSITNSWSSLRLMSIESVMPSSHLILWRPLLLLPPIPPSIRVFSNESLFAWGGQSTGVSALASFLPKKSQDWSPLLLLFFSDLL